MKKWIIAIVLLLAVGGLASWYWLRDTVPVDSFRVAPVKRGDVLATINATGTVEPEEIVDVGAQVAGIIDRFGQDPRDPKKSVDFNSEVTEGMLLAHIDDTTYVADVDSAQAAVDQAEANVLKSQADLLQAQAKLVEAQRNWDRAQKIGASDALSQNDYDMYQANYESAKATVAVDEAIIVQAQKSVLQYRATLKKATRNLAFCTITSPVNGTVIARRVNVGQTVVSSLSAPSLFLIAKDLRKMQVWASVNEADVGSIHKGQKVIFKVDTYPGREFQGVVNKVRYDATMTSNVVTYTAVISTDNNDMTLIPYLTANAQFIVANHDNVLTVPDAALHWNPQVSQVAMEFRDDSAKSPAPSAGEQSSPATAPSTRPAGRKKSDRGTVWIESGEYVKPVQVRVGISDGANTEIMVADASQLPEGTEVIIGDTIQDEGGAGGANPFLPQWGRGMGQQRNSRGGGGRGGGH